MGFISMDKQKPVEGQRVEFKFNRHRYGTLHSTDTGFGTYVGMNSIIDRPMAHMDYEDDECYLELTHWKPIKQKP